MSAAPPVLDRRQRATARGHAARRWLTPYAIVGVLAPVVFAGWYASSHPLSFDGAMNLQVAQSLATDGQFQRDYGGPELFPVEIQTSSYFVFLAAASLGALGTSNFTLQLANIIFVAVLAAGIAAAVRPSRVATLMAPSALILGAPGALMFSLGGYGEGAVAGLAIVAYILIARSVRDAKPATLVAIAFALIGAAVSIKTVAIAALPAAVLGTAYVWALAPVGRVRIAVAPLAAAIPVLAFELYRWAVLRDAYGAYWAQIISDVRYQAAGAPDGSTDGSLLRKVADHLHLLANQTNVAAEIWAAALVAVPALFTAVWWLARKFGAKDHLEHLLLAAMLILFAEMYFVWWLAVTPTEKAWLRRIVIGIIALALAAIITGMVFTRVFPAAGPGWWRLPLGLAASVTAALLLLQLVPTAVRTVATAAPDYDGTDALSDLAGDVERLSNEGAVFYGVGWWSAPAVSVYSGVDFGDLQRTDPCSAKLNDAAEEGDAYLVWDFYARSLANEPDPSWPGYAFSDTDYESNYGELWRIAVIDPRCPTG